MLIALRYGRAIAVEDPDISWSLSAVVDDLIGLRPDPGYVNHLTERYGPLLKADFRQGQRAVRGGDNGLADELLHKLRIDADSTRRAFTSGAEQAELGLLSPDLAPFLALIQWMPGTGAVISPAIEALGAWCLFEIVRTRWATVVPCENCGVPFVRLGHARYCTRPVPGNASLAACQELAAQRTHRSKHGDYQRERKRLHERKRRGRLSQEEYDAWRRSNNPTNWRRFESG